MAILTPEQECQTDLLLAEMATIEDWLVLNKDTAPPEDVATYKAGLIETIQRLNTHLDSLTQKNT